ncbi:MAG: response regulator transcription factor [Bacteroidia bacterium]|nr:response regulator transcription factor [Bacteroidia bacterium]
MSITVFNADDHPILRKGVTDLLNEQEGLEWVGSAENGEEALAKIRLLKPDVAILDIEMPRMTGLEVAKLLIEEGSTTEFCLLTLFKDESFFHHAIEAGIKGYLLKESSEQEIIACVHSLSKGRPYVNPSLTHYLIKPKNAKTDLLSRLSNHEINILKLISKQKTTAEIADMLFISPKTVGNHRSNIGKKLELSGEQNGLLRWALENKELLQ